MINWRPLWCSFSAALCPPVYRRWRFSPHRRLAWSQLAVQKALEPELLLMPEFLEIPGAFLDVGANNGDYVWVAQARKGGNPIVAVEPIPRLANLLRRAFPGIEVHNLALTDGEGPRWLKIPDIGGRCYATRATLNVGFTEKGETGRQLIEVATTTLDAFWKRRGDSPLACIKIDTEGHEFEVLKGARAVIARHRPVLMVEIEPRHHADGDVAAIFDWIETLGYTTYHFDAALPGLRLLQARPTLDGGAAGNPRLLNNYFFLPDGNEACRQVLERVNRKAADALAA